MGKKKKDRLRTLGKRRVLLPTAQIESRPVAAVPQPIVRKRKRQATSVELVGLDASVSSNSVPKPVEPISLVTYYSFLVKNHPQFQNYMPFVNLTEECDTGDLIGTWIVHNKPYKLAD